MLHIMHFDPFLVLGRQQIYEHVLNRRKFLKKFSFNNKIYLLLVSVLFVPPVDVVAQFTFISLPITKRLFIANNAFAAA